MNIFQDIIDIFTSFGIVDYILYIAVVTLIILIVSLIYVMKNENEGSEEVELKDVSDEMQEKMPLNEELDLQNIVNTLDESPKPIIDMTAYEEEQERKAIISYDELLQSANSKTISYDEEKLIDDVIPVKKIQTAPIELPKVKSETIIQNLDLKPKEPKIEIDELRTSSKMFSYEKEEAFLKALKELNELSKGTVEIKAEDVVFKEEVSDNEMEQ